MWEQTALPVTITLIMFMVVGMLSRAQCSKKVANEAREVRHWLWSILSCPSRRKEWRRGASLLCHLPTKLGGGGKTVIHINNMN